jgi:polyphosphate kinase
MPKHKTPPPPVISKEISWLYFNDRVLDEAADPTVPLIERLKFLGIYSSNLDEFFRVRVATLNRLAKAPRKKAIKLIGNDPGKVLKTVHQIISRNQEKFDQTLENLMQALAKEQISIVDETELDAKQGEFVRDYFQTVIRPRLFPVMVSRQTKFPELKDRSIYLAVCLYLRGEKKSSRYALIEIPTDLHSRFVLLPKGNGSRHIILLDDVIRYNLRGIFSAFSFARFRAYTIKLTRDAELDIDDDVFESYIRKVHKSLRQRKEGRPVRLVIDSNMPTELVNLITRKLKMKRDDPVVAGGRYHNIKDFASFPDVGRPFLRYGPLQARQRKDLSQNKSILQAISRQDLMLHFPYDSFDHIIDLLREASLDPQVTSIKITLYRAARNSSVVNALMNAVKNGKSVVAVVELQARFDEEANIYWANQLQEAGAKVVFGVPGLKVHAKICEIVRKESGSDVSYAIVGTGNFNEDTARLYTDHFLMTANKKITSEVGRVFEFLEHNYKIPNHNRLIVSPFNMRKRVLKFIETEIEHALQGKVAYIFLKLNHLTDTEMIEYLYRAGMAGVKIRLLVRGMFTLRPGVPGLSENIAAKRIVDRFLEHARVLIFANGGDERCYIASADWMPRNLDRRVEVACPILDPGLAKELKDILELQWRDNSKSSVHQEVQPLPVEPERKPKRRYRAQFDIYDYLRQKG